MNQPQPARDADETRAELVAYLDGELDHAAARQVERRLSEDPDYRRQLQQLQRTWDLLDHLPRVEASSSFATTTIEMVALTAADDVGNLEQRSRRRRLGLWSLQGLSVLAAGLLGFLALRSAQQAPERQFLRDLPVIENVDLYLIADDIDFVRMLEREKLFEQETPDAAAWSDPRR